MDFIKKYLAKFFLSDYLGGAVRHVFTVIGGLLVSAGLATPETVAEVVNTNTSFLTSEQFISGIIAILIGYGSSLLSKNKEIKAVGK